MDKLDRVQTIYFVSVIRPMSGAATSTHIMTNSLLKGMKQLGKEVVFFAICEYPEEKKDIISSYSSTVQEVIVLPSGFGHNLSNITNISLMLYHTFSLGFYKKAIKEHFNCQLKTPDLILSHSPSYESVCYCRIIKQMFKEVPYYQFWSDPIALSGILPEKMSWRRLPFRYVEKTALRFCNKIIYGNEALLYFQKRLYKQFGYKMSYINIPYVNKAVMQSCIEDKKVLYAGNYFKSIRDISVLVQALSQMEEYQLDVFGEGDCDVGYGNNVNFYGRISPDELAAIEGKYEFRICILNHSCIQIPGKIFYDMAERCKIIVLLDGTYADLIKRYLSKYERFLFCENSISSIQECIVSNQGSEVDLSRIKERFSPKRCAHDLIKGGCS